MSSKYIAGRFLIVIISLVYLFFSCCYVTKCQKNKCVFIFGNHTHSTAHLADHQNKTLKDSNTGKFPTRPRVISQDDKIITAFIAIVVLSCLFIGFNNKKEYYYPLVVSFKHLYSPNLIVSLGNFRI